MKVSEPKVKLILVWTLFWPGFDANREFGCNGSCIVTSDKNRVSEASAVVFNLCQMQSVLDYKPAGQLWVMFQLEPPIGCDLNVKAARYADVFDITVSYRRDSDIWRPYGLVSLEPNSRLGRDAWLPRVCFVEKKDGRRLVRQSL
ncbi:3-galactosyl-N-acetylglucosaminide 4-alpha-L-fucosyltransferase FUT3 [Halotydeus destructor]|nr:3-galactosyl-N-acetylglucosaminide 4-alpha-L-fucosyltransferase FUT3 [Halotydeus destructor]